MRQPNILVVLSDQQRPDSCGVFGQRLATTPVLDALAARGVAFDNAFTVQPLCGPSRAGIQTGRMPTNIGCWRNGLALPPQTATLATRLSDLGYSTGYVGKWHLASDRGPRLPAGRKAARFETRPVPPDRRGGYLDAWVAADALEHTSGPMSGRMFDEQGAAIDIEGFRVDGITDIAIDRLRRMDGHRPWILFVSFLEPHHQNNRFRTIGPAGEAKRFRDFEIPGDLTGCLGDWRWNYAQYLACCSSIDRNLGRLVDVAEQLGSLDDTLVVYSSDHGSHFRTRNLEYKRSCHDASIRIPLVVSGPGFDGGRHDERLVTNLDLVPTLVTAAGGAAPEVDGRPLQPEPAQVPWRDHVLVQISESQIGRCLRTQRYTYGVRAPTMNPFAGIARAASADYVESHLYDNTADPSQRHNLVKDPSTAELRAALAAQLVLEIEKVEHLHPTIRPAKRSAGGLTVT